MSEVIAGGGKAVLDACACVEAYEAAQSHNGQANLAEFLLKPEHPLYLVVLRELVRVDMEYGWQYGKPHYLEEYLHTFPLLAAHPDALHDVGFEEFRLRKQAGQRVVRSEYQQRFGIDTACWPLFIPSPKDAE
jgi:hypothetical protein